MAFVVPKECYINFKFSFDWQTGEVIPTDVPLGFATYKEDNKAFEKRKDTIDNWACTRNVHYLRDENRDWIEDENGRRKYEVFEAERPMETFDNIAMAGFKMSREIKRYGWNGGNVVWRIEDPRGFELEISSQNMAKIMEHCVIDKGEIKSPCLWGWDKTGGSRIVLLPEGSEPYLEAMRDNALHNATVATKDIKLGDKIQLKNGAKGTYYGAMSVLMRGYIDHAFKHRWTQHERDQGLVFEDGKWVDYGSSGVEGYQFFTRRRYILELEDGNFYAVSNLKAAFLLERCEEEFTKEEIVDYVHQALSEGKIVTDHHEIREYNNTYNNSGIAAIAITKKEIDESSLVMIPSDKFDPDTYESRRDESAYRLYKLGDFYYKVYGRHRDNKDDFEIERFHVDRMELDKILVTDRHYYNKTHTLTREALQEAEGFEICAEVGEHRLPINTQY